MRHHIPSKYASVIYTTRPVISIHTIRPVTYITLDALNQLVSIYQHCSVHPMDYSLDRDCLIHRQPNSIPQVLQTHIVTNQVRSCTYGCHNFRESAVATNESLELQLLYHRKISPLLGRRIACLRYLYHKTGDIHLYHSTCDLYITLDTLNQLVSLYQHCSVQPMDYSLDRDCLIRRQPVITTRVPTNISPN